MRRRRFWLTLAVLVALLAYFPVIVFAQGTEVAGQPLGNNLPPVQQWQALCITFGAVVIAGAIRAWATITGKPPTKGGRKLIANVITIGAALLGLYLDHQLDNFTPTIAGLLYVVALTQVAYDKLWQAIPGLKDLIYAIDPWSEDNPDRASNAGLRVKPTAIEPVADTTPTDKLRSASDLDRSKRL